MSFTAGSSSGRPASVLGKIGISLFFGVFLAMGLIFIGLAGREVWKTFATYAWKPTPATMVGSEVRTEKRGEDPFTIAVKYRYQWEGREYVSEQFSRSKSSHDSYDAASGKISALPAGTVTTCYVNPKNPTEAILRRDGLWLGLFLVIPLVFVLVGGGGIYGTWFGRTARPGPLSSSSSSKSSRVFLLLFGGLFAAVGAGLLIFWYLPALTKSLASSSWTKTPCTVISSRVNSNSGKNGTTYSVDIFYRYSVEGREYRSNRYDLFGGSSSGRAGKAKIVARYPAGRTAVCYVNPKNPQEVVLKAGVGLAALFGLIPLLFLGAGIAVMVSGFRTAPNSKTAVSVLLPQAGVDGEPLVLKPSVSPLGKLLGTVAFALFWNGIVAVFLWDLVGDFQQGHPNWFLALFLTPFVLIGLGAVGAIGYFAMALTNPRCQLQVNPPSLMPGEGFTVSWEFRGSVQRIGLLRIYLEGREEATYRRGTSNCTDRAVFARIPVTEVSSWMEMGQGEARARLPEGVMPSFSASNNKIVWELKVKGEISHWPDVDEEYPVGVMPVGGGKS